MKTHPIRGARGETLSNRTSASQPTPPPSRGRLGGGWGLCSSGASRDRSFSPHPHPIPPLEGEGVAAARAFVHRGFTLIEILVVVSILAILGALVVPKIMDRPNEARVVAAKQDIGTLVAALKLYKLDNGRYPTTEQGLKSLLEKPMSEPVPANWKNGGYLEKAPKDPWGRDYIYLNPGLKGEIDVMSYGADGQQGGEGYDADIGSWMQ